MLLFLPITSLFVELPSEFSVKKSKFDQGDGRLTVWKKNACGAFVCESERDHLQNLGVNKWLILK